MLLRLLIGAALALAALPDAAAQQDKAAREQIRRLQADLQRARQDKAQADAQLAEAKKKAEEAAAEAAAGVAAAQGAAATERKSRAAVETEVAKLKGELAGEEKKLKDAQAAIDALQRKAALLGKTLAEREQAGKTLEVVLAQEKKERAVCEDKNLKLYQYGQEVLEKYRTKGVWDALAQGEPFTGIKDVEVYNVLQEYRDKLGDNRATPPAPAN
jgi:DNA repair exonuclease SbcCD ATPase subunit